MQGEHVRGRVIAVLLLCLAGGLVGVAATGSADAAAGETESGLTGERALNTTGPGPGETVRVTTTVTREGEGAIDYLDTFDPEFESSELVSVTEGGEEISESLKGMFPDTIFVVAEEVGPEVVEFVYDITVPADASHGETFTFGGTVQTDEANATVGGVSSFTVGGEPFFAVDLDPVESVAVGEDLAVEATVTNTGDGGGEGSVAFAVDGEEQASTPVELDGGESQTVAFEYATTAADTPEIDVAVSSADETDSTSVEVLRPAAFDVGLESLPESVGVGEDLAVEATVTNTGDETGTQAVTFTVNEGIEGSQDLTLDGGESEPVLFEYATTAADAPEVEVAVSSANETATATVGVAELAAFEVAFELRTGVGGGR